MQTRFGNTELGVALIVFCRLWGFVSSGESHFFFHVLTSAGMDAVDDRSWTLGMTGHDNSILGGWLYWHMSAWPRYLVEALGRAHLSI